MATLSIMLTWKIPWAEEPGKVQSMGSQESRYDLATKPPLLYLLRGQRLEFLKSTPPGIYGSYHSTHMCK